MAKKNKSDHQATLAEQEILLGVVSDYYWNSVINDIQGNFHFLLDGWDDERTDYVESLDLGHSHPDVHPYFEKLYKPTLECVIRLFGIGGSTVAIPYGTPIPPELQSALADWIREMKHCIRPNKWTMLDRMVDCEMRSTYITKLMSLARDPLSPPTSISWYDAAMTALILSLGGPRRFLYGTKGNKAAFIELSRPIRSALDLMIIMRLWNLYDCSSRLDESDRDLIPDPFSESSVEYRDKGWPQGATIEDASEILRDAYYNTHFTLHPDGTYVELAGNQIIKRMLIKSKQSPVDPNSQDLFARITVNDGDFVMVWRSELLDEGNLARAAKVQYVAPQAFLYVVVAQIYHDLVTCRHVGEGLGMSGPQGSSQSPERPSKPFLRSIPRIVRNLSNDHVARLPLPVPRTGKPHFVSGHPRKVPISDQQRQRIIEFEKETGLHILSHLKPGETWVHPHISPKDGSYDSLPHFIKYQMERDLDLRLRKMRANTSDG